MRQLRRLERLRDRSEAPEALTSIVPGCQPLRSSMSGMKYPTLVMSILNVTPDSFSDGGDHQPGNLEKLRATAASHIAAGATIIDIGGQSSRPGAVDITADEELARVLPAIEAIKSLPEASKVAISVDTYRASVAKAAVEAGAHIVNDISAGTLDSKMLATVAELGCTYIMMHMRGTPSTMQNEENTRYPEGKLIETIANELNARVRAAQDAGIRRWRIVLDPGVGFSKTTHQNLEILQDLQWLRSLKRLGSLPWLIGTSRKNFIGQITGAAEPKDRAFGTAAAVTAAIQGGASIVRVHDVAEMAQVAKMADAIFKARGHGDQAAKESQETQTIEGTQGI